MTIVEARPASMEAGPHAAERELRSFDPNTGVLLGEAPIRTADEVRAAVARARAAQPVWAARGLRGRIAVMRRVQEALVDHADAIARLCSREVGKLEAEALVGDVLLVLTSLDGYLKLAPRVLRPRRLRQGLLHSAKRTYVVQEPLGVVAVISPFNFPVLLSMQSAFAALIAGNAVVQKPSEYTPLTALKIQEILYSAGLPRGLLEVVTGDRETGRALVEADVNHIALVGSTATGRAISKVAGERLIPVTMELGGNNAMIVLDDAPLERAVAGALTWANVNSGQVCGSVARLYVHAAIADQFTERLQTEMRKWRPTTDTRPGAGEVAALVDERALQQVERHVRDAVAQGARVLAGGRRVEGCAAPLFQPTLLVDTRPEMAIMREETFGPVFSLMRVRDADEAVRLANDSDYGLTASVWSNDKRRAWEVARKLQVGSVAVNDHLWPFFAPEAPWGGVKGSGMGRVGGEWGLRAMTYPKAIAYDKLNLRREFYWPPYRPWLYDLFRQAIPLLYSRRMPKKVRALGRIVELLLDRPWNR